MAIVKGTRDILPPETDFLYELNNKIHRIFSLYGFEEIETPILEYTELFQRSIGDFTDIVQKEMFTINDRKGRSICLRPEGTAGVIRAYIDNGLAFSPGVKKFFYSGAMFRAERPQKGRLREFHQFGCEVIGSNNPLLEAEIIEMNFKLLNELGLDNLTLKINSVGCKECRKSYIKKLQDFLFSHYNELCDDCKIRAKNNPLRVFDCKNEKCQAIYNNAPKLRENLCDNCNSHFNEFQEYLNNMNLTYVIDDKLVRGFDYYTNTVFEVTTNVIGSQNAILGGGRYNYLVEELGGKYTPAVGAAAGIERIYIALSELDKIKIKKNNIKVYVAIAGNISHNIWLQILKYLRDNNYITITNYENKSLKSQFKEADKLDSDYVIILGEEELKENKISIKNLKTSNQKIIELNNFYSGGWQNG